MRSHVLKVLAAALLLFAGTSAFATTLVGSQTATAAAGTWSGGYVPFTAFHTFVASASGTATTISIDMYAGHTGSSVLCAIYAGTGTSQLAVATAPSSLATGIITQTLSTGVAITSGTSYTLACQFNYGYPNIATDGTTGYIQEDDTAQTFGTLPASITNSSGAKVGVPAIWASSAAAPSAQKGGMFFGGGPTVPRHLRYGHSRMFLPTRKGLDSFAPRAPGSRRAA